MRRFILISTIIVLSTIGCNVEKSLVEKEDDVYQIVNLQSSLLSKHRLYYKTYVVEKSMFNFPNEYFKCSYSNPNYELARKKTDSITTLDIPEDRKEMLLKQVEEKYIANFVPNVIPQEELKRMREGLTSKPWKWNQELIRSKMTRRTDYNSVSFSVPALNADKDYAIMLLQFSGSVEARIYKKENGLWTYYCYYPLVISD